MVDADVVISALDAVDAHHADARVLFAQWRERADGVAMSVVNLSEVLIPPAADRRRLRKAREAIAALGVSTHAPTEAIGVDAARLRGRHPISLPDAYLLATARQTSSTVVSFDRKVLAAAAVEGLASTGPPATTGR